MPLSIAKMPLGSDVKTAYDTSLEAGGQEGANPTQIITDLAKDVSDAIHDYVTSAVVNTDVDIKPGRGSTGVPGTSAGTGKTTVPEAGFGVGTLDQLGLSKPALNAGIKKAFTDEMENGKSAAGPGDEDNILRAKAVKMSAVIHAYVKSAKVNTVNTYPGGAALLGDTNLQSGVPIPGMTLPGGTGSGEGELL